jgi:hypothetical protein
VGFVVDKVALGQVFSEYFGFTCQSSFHQLLHNHPHLSSGAGTIGQKWPQYKGLSPTPLAIKKPMDAGENFSRCKAAGRQGVKLTTHFHLVPTSKIVELYLHSSLYLLGVVFN